MSPPSTLTRHVEAVERACAAAHSPDELLADVSDLMHRIVPHDGAAWFGVDPVTLLGAAPSRVENLDPAMCDTFWHLEFHHHDVGLFADLARGDNDATALRLALDGGVGRSPRYRDFLRPQRYEDELRAVLRSARNVWGMVGLYRESSARPFSAEDVAVVKAVSRPIAEALRGHVRASLPWLSQPTAPGLLVVDADGRVVAANADAAAWLHELWPGLGVVGRLGTDAAESGECAEPGERAEPEGFARRIDPPTALHALVSRARAVAGGHERTPARLRLRDSRGRWLVLHASALVTPGSSAVGEVAVVVESAKGAEIAPIIIDAYGLTIRERQVLGAIARGGTTAEIARDLQLSQHTVRDHVKAVFEKVGVSSRGELVARLFGEHYSDRLHHTMVEVH